MKKFLLSFTVVTMFLASLLCLFSCNDVEQCDHIKEIIQGKAPTCTESGLTDGKKCTVCGDIIVEQEVIEPMGHIEITIDGRAATCTEEGLTDGKQCFVCKVIVLEQAVIRKAPHTEAEIPEIKPTCTETGLSAGKKCSVCNTVTVEQSIVPMSAHIEIDIPEIKASCTKTGLTAGKKCSVCNTVTVEQEIIPLKKHNEITLKAVAPTCTEDGLTSGKKCITCNTVTVKQAVVPMLPHKEVDMPVSYPTCTDGGFAGGKICSVCQTVTVEQTAIPENGHTIGKWISEIPFTCGEDGIRGHYHCYVCEKDLDHDLNILDSTVIPKMKDHTYTKWGIVEAYGCSDASFRIRFCTDCEKSEIYSEDKSFVNPHSFKMFTSEPTLTKSGYLYKFECEDCRTVAVEQTTPCLAYESSTWKGKKWCAIGDSITIRQGNYVSTVANALGLEATNLGISGANAGRIRLSISGEDDTSPDYTPERKQAVIDADLITIYGFANDYYPGAPALGDLYDSKPGTYAYNVKALIEEVLTLNPTARIVIIGCHNIWDYYRPDIYQPVNGDNNIADYIDMLDDIANYYGLPFIDMYHDSGINEFSASVYLADGCHPTPAGYERISEIIIKRLNIL